MHQLFVRYVSEGFCVPLIEAFYKQVSVLAYAAPPAVDMDGAESCSMRRNRHTWRL